MDDYPWRRLGELLVERGLLDAYDLESALKQQRLTGMLLGELLVARRMVSPVEIAAALALQHGVAVERAGVDDGGSEDEGGDRAASVWKPLGRILVERDLITESGLQRALLQQRRTGRALGEILVERGYVSAPELAAALAAQQGVEIEPSTLREAPGEPRAEHPGHFEVRRTLGGEPLYSSLLFLDATDFAFELLEAEDPVELVIVSVAGGDESVAWSYVRPALTGAAGV